MTRRLALLLATLVALAFPSIARADNSAVAINTKDGASIFKLAWKVKRIAGDTVAETNAAVAYSSCTNCEATAIAIQIVLVTGNPSVVTPENYAISINENCTLCESFAAAYQFVIGTGGPVKFSKEGKEELRAIKRELKALRDEDLTPFELGERIRPLMDRLRNVLRTQLVPLGPGDEEQGDEEEVEEGEQADDDGGGGAAEDEGTETMTTPSGTTTSETPTTSTTETAPTQTTPTTTDTGPTATTPTETESETETETETEPTDTTAPVP